MAPASLNLTRCALLSPGGRERTSGSCSYEGSTQVVTGRRLAWYGAVSFIDGSTPAVNRIDTGCPTFPLASCSADSRLSRHHRNSWRLSYSRPEHGKGRILSSYEGAGVKVKAEAGRVRDSAPNVNRSWEGQLSGEGREALAEGGRLNEVCGFRDAGQNLDDSIKLPSASEATSRNFCVESSSSNVVPALQNVPDQLVHNRVSTSGSRVSQDEKKKSVDVGRHEYCAEELLVKERSGGVASSSLRAEVVDVSAARLRAEREDRRRKKSVQASWEALLRWSKWSMQKLSNATGNDDVLANTRKVVVLGGGSFGTAMAVMLARNKPEMDVVLLLRDQTVCETVNELHVNRKYFPKHTLPENVRATTSPAEAISGAQFAIHAVPVQQSTKFLARIAPHVPATLPILSVSKGLEVSTLEMMSQLIPRALGNARQPVAVLSGPSFSIELMDKLPTAMVAASRDAKLARAAQQLLASPYLRVNTSSDVVGVEMAGALKNVLAIAAGIVEGMSLGNNCMAALVAQGCSEIRWLAEKMGAKSATLAGLSGTGDIMLTCFVKLSRNRSVGVRIGRGERLEDILASMNQVAEGVATAGAVIALARKYRVSIPVLTAVARILDNELTPKVAVMELMSLPQVEEV